MPPKQYPPPTPLKPKRKAPEVTSPPADANASAPDSSVGDTMLPKLVQPTELTASLTMPSSSNSSPATELDAALQALTVAPGLKDNRRVLGTSLRMKYGAVEIEYEIREIANPQTLAEQESILDRQTAQLNHQQDMFAETWFVQMKERGLIPNNRSNDNGKKGKTGLKS